MSEHHTMRESMLRDSITAIKRGSANIGKNGVRKCEPANPSKPMAYFQSKDFDKACGNPLLVAFAERKIVKAHKTVNGVRYVAVKGYKS